MEILKGYESTVKFVVPQSLAMANFVVRRGGHQIGSVRSATVSDGLASVELPYEALMMEGDVEIELFFLHQFVRHAQTKTVTVVTPLLELYEVKEALDEPVTNTQAKEAEATVRMMINSITGQTFGHHTATHQVYANNAASIELPERLISIKRINGVVNAGAAFRISGDGWFLSVVPGDIPPLKADFWGLHRLRGGVIENPNMVNVRNLPNMYLSIHGEWGWPAVPEQIKEAARLLINDYFDPDSIYRDRYLTSMTAADWRIQFNDEAFTNTGNAKADKLLKDFTVNRGWLVI